MASQAGSQAVGSSVPPNIPTREGPSHADNNTTTQVGRQADAPLDTGPPRLPKGNSATSLASSTRSWEGTQPPTLPNRLPQGSSSEDPNPKWVINLSSKHLIQAQRSVLAKGPNFVVSPSTLLT